MTGSVMSSYSANSSFSVISFSFISSPPNDVLEVLEELAHPSLIAAYYPCAFGRPVELPLPIFHVNVPAVGSESFGIIGHIAKSRESGILFVGFVKRAGQF